VTEALTLQQQRDALLTRMVRDEWQKIREFVRRRIGDADAADDIAQDVFSQLVMNPDLTVPIERLTGWLYTVARNRVIDWYRKKKTASFSDVRRNDDAGDSEIMLFDDELNPERLYYRELIWESIQETLDELPVEQRDVFVMHEFEGKSFKEIARLTGEPMSTLLSRKRYAVLYLREQLRDLYDELFSKVEGTKR
jgi:RNA polymerase sigma factor (sigma-70 family)